MICRPCSLGKTPINMSNTGACKMAKYFLSIFSRQLQCVVGLLLKQTKKALKGKKRKNSLLSALIIRDCGSYYKMMPHSTSVSPVARCGWVGMEGQWPLVPWCVSLQRESCGGRQSLRWCVRMSQVRSHGLTGNSNRDKWSPFSLFFLSCLIYLPLWDAEGITTSVVEGHTCLGQDTSLSLFCKLCAFRLIT